MHDLEKREQDPPAQPPQGSPGASPAERLVEDLPQDTSDTFHDDERAEPRPKRRLRLPLILFFLTCLSTFWAGATNYMPTEYLPQGGDGIELRRVLLTNWNSGLTYMACVLAILMTHELGHFFATVRYRIPASYPFFLPFPISPLGTLGAVIGMDGMRANRKEMFDIGIAGPIAGLVVAAPIICVGVMKLDFTDGPSSLAVEIPFALRMFLDYYQPTGYSDSVSRIGFNQLNPYLMAGWVALLVTGLNMLPVGQLDGGHVAYTLFGRFAHWMARCFLVLWIAFAVYSASPSLAVMSALLLFVGPDHPPTCDDNVKLGPFRVILGSICVFIPVVCLRPPFISF